jgi:rfaE bifunctional protein kinase chain/domain
MARTKYVFREISPSSWDKNRLLTFIKQRSNKRILIVGDVGVDRYTEGSVERISPEAPVPIVFVQEEKLKLGLAANVADNVKTLGGAPYLVGVVGKDRGAQDFRLLLRRNGIPASYLIADGTRRTVLKERIVSDRQQLLRVDYESQHPMDGKIGTEVLDQVEALLPKVDWVIVEDYAKGLIGAELARKIFALARSHKKNVAVDPNTKTLLSIYRGAYLLTPNTREAEALAGMRISDAASLAQAGFKLLEGASARHIVITRGKDGMAIFTRGSSEIVLIPTYAREVYDVSGAGDTVISMLALALSSGASIEEAAVLGNLAAGVEVGKRGTATVSPDEVRTALEFFGTISG